MSAASLRDEVTHSTCAEDGMFAVVSSDEHTATFVRRGFAGSRPCKAMQMEEWIHMNNQQGADVTEAALQGSMVGWTDQAAQLAVLWNREDCDKQRDASNAPREILLRAISIRQPLVEMILTCEKELEFRAKRTHIRERVYLYASKQLANVEDFPQEEAVLLPRGVIVGSIAIIDCVDAAELGGDFGYYLARPVRYEKTFKPKGMPQPCFWRPTF